MSILAYWLEEYVGLDLAWPAAWAVTIAVTAFFAGVVYLIINGG